MTINVIRVYKAIRFRIVTPNPFHDFKTPQIIWNSVIFFEPPLNETYGGEIVLLLIYIITLKDFTLYFTLPV